MTAVYFVQTTTGKRYKVIKMDHEAGKVTLRGEYGEFVEPYSKARFERLGYKVEKVEDEDDTVGQPKKK